MKSKKVFLSCLAMLCSLSIFASCGDDNSTSSSAGGSVEQSTSSSQASEEASSEEVESSEEVVSSEEVESSEEVVSSEEAESSEEIVSSEEVVESSEEVVSSEEAESSEAVESTESVESIESTESSEEVESSEIPVETYTIIFLDSKGNVLSETVYNAGEEVVVPEAPAKEADETYTYEFAGWDKSVTVAVKNATYIATYTSTYIEYTVTFLNEDGSEISVQTYHYGDEVVAPTDFGKEADETYTYEFAGWDTEVTAVAGNATYTATYEAVYIEYTTTFLNEDGTLHREVIHHYDELYNMDSPLKESTEYFDYAFLNWEKQEQTEAYKTTYVAKYEATLKDGINANDVSGTVGEGVVLNAGGIGDGANYTKGQQNGGYVRQSYLALDGNYGVNDYVALDFTGKNMPEIAFFANNYDESMYANGTEKEGIVVYTGITTYNGENATITQSKANGTYINYSYPYMIQDAADGGFVRNAFKDSALGRANLVDGKHYRVIMGFEGKNSEGTNGITLHWYLYDIDTATVVEQASIETWNFFTGSNAQVGNMTVNDLKGSVVLYGKFGTACTLDKVYGVFEDTTIEAIANGLSSEETYTVTFQDENGKVLYQEEQVAFGTMITNIPEIPESEPIQSAVYNYTRGWDKAITRVMGDCVYTVALVASLKDNVKLNNTTSENGVITLGASNIGAGANYISGQNAGGSVTQSYLAIDGEYGLGNYVSLDFTGKNMPEVAFFAKNYNTSMYAEGTSKQGIVVITGVTEWNGVDHTGMLEGGKQIQIDNPFMIKQANEFWMNKTQVKDAKLARVNLVDGTNYRVIMGFKGGSTHGANGITLEWTLYNLDTQTIVEQQLIDTWAFFTGSNAQVNNMTLNDLVGSIVFYGKFGTTCTFRNVNVESGEYASIVAKYTQA